MNDAPPPAGGIFQHTGPLLAGTGTSPEKKSGPSSAGALGPGLVVDRIGKAFRGRQVVKGVSLHLERGEVAGLLGPNGAGKTTCFYMITGLIAADYGIIWLDGEDITHQPMYQRARGGAGLPAPGNLDLSRHDRRAERHGRGRDARRRPRQGARDHQ
jgi:ABC-type hemin transport system ATPase subunit